MRTPRWVRFVVGIAVISAIVVSLDRMGVPYWWGTAVELTLLLLSVRFLWQEER